MRLNVFAALGLGVGLLAYAGTDGVGSNLADAIRDGNREQALALLKQHVDVNAPQADGRRRFKGRLLGLDGNDVVLGIADERLKFPFRAIADAKLVLTDRLIEEDLKARKHAQ